jgi:hypothetical protein
MGNRKRKSAIEQNNKLDFKKAKSIIIGPEATKISNQDNVTNEVISEIVYANCIYDQNSVQLNDLLRYHGVSDITCKQLLGNSIF